nr:peptidylprolyl isomerase [Gemmobacter straminiformis]
MAEFAGRANLDVPAFVKAISDEGVEPETFRDFVTAGLLWREVVRKKFGGTVRISEVQIDRALAEAARKPDVRLLLSELVVPVPEGADAADVLAEVRDIKANLGAEGGFAAAARKYSAAPTADRGGRLDWLELSKLPPAIGNQLLGLAQGEVSDPVVVPQAVVLFQLNGLSDLETPQPTEVLVSYARFALAADQDPAEILSRVDGCDDLYPLARDLPADRLTVTEEMPMAQVPLDIGLALAKLDPDEAVVRPQSGYNELLMLCLRNGIVAEPEATAAPEAADAAKPTPEPQKPAATEGTEKPAAESTVSGEFEKPDPQREAVRGQLGNRQISALADAYMEELRSEAIIETP